MFFSPGFVVVVFKQEKLFNWLQGLGISLTGGDRKEKGTDFSSVLTRCGHLLAAKHVR